MEFFQHAAFFDSKRFVLLMKEIGIAAGFDIVVMLEPRQKMFNVCANKSIGMMTEFCELVEIVHATIVPLFLTLRNNRFLVGIEVIERDSCPLRNAKERVVSKLCLYTG